MRSMPLKPLRKVFIRGAGPGRYTVTLAFPLENETHFRKILLEDVAPCLGQEDAYVNPDWPSRTFTLLTDDIAKFRQQFACRRYLIREDFEGPGPLES